MTSIPGRQTNSGASRGRGRGRSGERCAGCGLHLALCMCALVPRMVTRTRIVLLTHHGEQHRTTNTGRLAHACLSNSARVIWGPTAVPAEEMPWAAGSTPVLLFPGPEAVPLDAWYARTRPEEVTLIVLDGSWSQARRMRLRVPALSSVARVALAPGAPSQYRLRRAPGPARLSTIEAVARALDVLEGPEPRRTLESVLAIMVERTLRMRGQASAAEQG